MIRSQRIAEKARREICGPSAFVKQRSPRRRTLGLQSVRAPGGIRTHNLRLRHSCALSVELQRHAVRKLDELFLGLLFCKSDCG